MGTIHSIKVDGEEIIPDLRYNIAPHNFVHRGKEGFGLREAVNKILNRKKEIEELEIAENKALERRKEERKELDKKREEYYEKHMKEETERINRLVEGYNNKLKEINEAPADERPKMLSKLYRFSQKNKHLRVTITSFGTLNAINCHKYPPELEYPKCEIEESSEIYYDSPTIPTLPSGYKPYNYRKYFNQTVKTYQGQLDVHKKLVNSIRGLLGPKDKYTVNEFKDTISNFKFKKDLINSIVCKLNDDLDYKSLTEVQKYSLFRYKETFRTRSHRVLGKHVKHKSNVIFHLLRLVSCDPNPDNFPLKRKVSNEKTETEIEAVFQDIGWECRPMGDYTNDVISLIINLSNYFLRFKSKSTRSTLECV